MKDETRGAAIGNFLRLKPKMYSFLVDNSEHKKAKGVNRNAVATTSHKEAKGVNRNAVATTSHNEYKEVLLVNSKCIRHWIECITHRQCITHWIEFKVKIIK